MSENRDRLNDQKRKVNTNTKGIIDGCMGLLYIFFPLLPYYYQKTGKFNFGMPMVIAFGALVFIYGAFRLYRAYLQLIKRRELN